MPPPEASPPPPISLSRLLGGHLEAWAASDVLSPSACELILSAVRSAPADVDHRHLPLETLDGGAHLPTAQRVVERLRAVSAYHAELRLQRAFCVRYSGEGDGHAAHRDPCAFTVNVALTPAADFAGGDLAFHPSERADASHSVGHELGGAILHAGAARHSAVPLSCGERCNLILWLDRAPTASIWSAMPPALQARCLRLLDLSSLSRFAAASRSCAEDAAAAPQWASLRRALEPPRTLLARVWGCAECTDALGGVSEEEARRRLAAEPEEARHVPTPLPLSLAALAALHALAAAVDALQRPQRAAPEDLDLAEARRVAARSRVASRVAAAVAAAEAAERGSGAREAAAQERGTIVFDVGRVRVL